ncbi:heavy metal-associated isoprenylated plant protein 14-like [Zingiber officinale]|uniref:heavy metal-associated isoprenylated plant protein 14-like n=1 Tax=Zingiber officinale TaxID=94328 RepID=UPI001C4AC64D|nr:heavy metal-associated isoprenylated plant protein 14-like [Zingiber officinale]
MSNQPKMVKQKVVMRLPMEDAKRRSKALRTAVGLPGVVSVSLDKDRLTVVGEGIDSVALTVVLRKKMGPVELLSVGDDRKDDKIRQPSSSSSSSSAVGTENKSTWSAPPISYNYAYQAQPYYHPYPYEVRSADQENCSIM